MDFYSSIGSSWTETENTEPLLSETDVQALEKEVRALEEEVARIVVPESLVVPEPQRIKVDCFETWNIVRANIISAVERDMQKPPDERQYVYPKETDFSTGISEHRNPHLLKLINRMLGDDMMREQKNRAIAEHLRGAGRGQSTSGLRQSNLGRYGFSPVQTNWLKVLGDESGCSIGRGLLNRHLDPVLLEKELKSSSKA